MPVKSVTIRLRDGKPLKVVTRFTGDDDREITRIGGTLATLVVLAEAMNEDAFEGIQSSREEWDRIMNSDESQATTNLCFGAAVHVVRRMFDNPSQDLEKTLGKVLFRLAYREANGTLPNTAITEYSYSDKETGGRMVVIASPRPADV